MERHNSRVQHAIVILLAALCASIIGLSAASAAPTGASLSSNTTDYGPTRGPVALTHNRSTITTVVLDALQQSPHWKAYVGNVTGRLTLQDSGNNTIYDWASFTTPTGEVYAARNSSISFTSPVCANATTIASEMTALNHTVNDSDSISKTFNSTDHASTQVGGTTLANCNSTTLYVNNASQGQNSTADFQEILMQDNSNLVYISRVNNNKVGYNGLSFDFQMLVAESHIQAPSTYYFWLELAGT